MESNRCDRKMDTLVPADIKCTASHGIAVHLYQTEGTGMEMVCLNACFYHIRDQTLASSHCNNKSNYFMRKT